MQKGFPCDSLVLANRLTPDGVIHKTGQAMKIDLKKLTGAELETLIEDAQKELKSVRAREKNEALKAAKAAAAKYGFSLDELSGGTAKSKGPKSAPKYANPNDPSQTWSGRGRKPQWVHDAIAKGIDMSKLEI